MPAIERYACSRCDFSMPTGWGSYTYAIDADGKRVHCPHPGECAAVARITGLSYPDAVAAGKTGRMDHCVCATCLKQTDFDIRRDDLKCPECSAREINTANDSVGKTCPKCSVGIVELSSPVQWPIDPDWESLPVPEIVKDIVLYHNTRKAPASLAAAAATFSNDLFVILLNLMNWWEGNSLAAMLGKSLEPRAFLELRPDWKWCKLLPELLDVTPDLARLVVIQEMKCRFSESMTTDERRGIKNFVRKHVKHHFCA